MKDATLTEATCLEEFMAESIKNQKIEKQVFAYLWRILKEDPSYIASSARTQQERVLQEYSARAERRAAMQLLRIAGKINIDYLISY